MNSAAWELPPRPTTENAAPKLNGKVDGPDQVGIFDRESAGTSDRKSKVERGPRPFSWLAAVVVTSEEKANSGRPCGFGSGRLFIPPEMLAALK
jgi:hypothetical protein